MVTIGARSPSFALTCRIWTSTGRGSAGKAEPQTRSRVGVDALRSALPDMDVDRAGVGREGVAPDPLQDLVPGQHQTAVADQVGEQLELPGGELYRPALEGDLVAGGEERA